MKIILTEDVDSLGEKGDIVKVANGYANNYLIPKGLASRVTASGLKRLEEEKKVYQRKLKKLKGVAEEQAKTLSSLTCTFSLKAGEDEKVFGAITSIDIEEFIKNNGHSIDKKQIHLAEPIKTFGTFDVPIKLHPEVTFNLKVAVVKKEES